MAQEMRRSTLRVYKTAKFNKAKRCELITLVNGVAFIMCRVSAKTYKEAELAAYGYLKSPVGNAHSDRIVKEFPAENGVKVFFTFARRIEG